MTTRRAVPHGRTHAAVAALAAIAVIACTASATSPIVESEATLELQVTGGIAGVDYRVVLDGRDRTVRLSCAIGCETGGDVVAISDAQWQSLLDEVAVAGLPTLGIRDYGTGCCDLFAYVLRFEDPSHLARVSGDASTLPPTLARLAERVVALRDGRVDVLLSSLSSPGAEPQDHLTIDSARVTGNELALGVTYSGGCALHEIDLVVSTAWMESHPVQAAAWLTHDDRGDECDALPHEIRTFELSRLFAAYRSSYPGSPAGERIIVTLRAPGDPEPTTVELVVPAPSSP